MKPARIRVIAYARSCTTDPNGVSIAGQIDQMLAYAKKAGLEVVGVECDIGIVGTTEVGRPGLTRAFTRIDADESGGLLVVRLDRITRDARELNRVVRQCDNRGDRLIAVDEEIDTGMPSGRHVISLLRGVMVGGPTLAMPFMSRCADRPLR